MGVLVTVSIPIFTAQLEKSRESTDLANQRASKAAFVSELLVPDKTDTDGDGAADAGTYYYDAAAGTTTSSVIPSS